MCTVPHEEPTGKGLVVWFILTAFTQLLWGLYPVASRYIEVQYVALACVSCMLASSPC